MLLKDLNFFDLMSEGHTTMTCAHRVTMEHGVIPAQKRSTKTPLYYVFQRELQAKLPYMVGHSSICGRLLV
jgi:hypothetical protein